MRETDSQLERPSGAHRRYSARRQWLSLAFLALTTTALLLTVMLGARASAERVSLSSSTVEALNAEPQDYSKFSHTSPGAHAGFSNPSSCADCHQRNGAAVTPIFPGHKACINCHLAQFTTTNIAMCTICHVNDLGNPNPALKGFPRLRSFRVSFDHSQHVLVGALCTPAEPDRGMGRHAGCVRDR